jgi:hypothetical protein
MKIEKTAKEGHSPRTAKAVELREKMPNYLDSSQIAKQKVTEPGIITRPRGVGPGAARHKNKLQTPRNPPDPTHVPSKPHLNTMKVS